MTTANTISRRGLLAATPLAAAAIALPGTASARTSDLAGWHRAKADYAAAIAAEDQAIARHDEAEGALAQFWRTAPEETITVHEPAWTHGTLTVAAYDRPVTLTRHNLGKQPHAVKMTDAYAAYCLRVSERPNACDNRAVIFF